MGSPFPNPPSRGGAPGRADVERLRAAGLDDRSILDLAQVAAYFCYANRIVLGLGAELEPFEPGQHPSDERGA